MLGWIGIARIERHRLYTTGRSGQHASIAFANQSLDSLPSLAMFLILEFAS
jgi:hypothetical protein